MLRRVALELPRQASSFVVVAFPVYWMVATAFKQGQDVLSYEPVWLPRDPTLASFRDAISQPYFWDGVKNSLIVVCSVVATRSCSRSSPRWRSRSSVSTGAGRSSS